MLIIEELRVGCPLWLGHEALPRGNARDESLVMASLPRQVRRELIARLQACQTESGCLLGIVYSIARQFCGTDIRIDATHQTTICVRDSSGKPAVTDG